MIFTIKMMSGADVPLENEEEVKRFLEEANAGKKLILTKYGIVNVASVDSIVPDKKKMEAVKEYVGMGRNVLEAEGEGESHTVVEELRPGYLLHGKVLIPAKVKVIK